MVFRPEIGAMIRCVAPKYEAGAVTYYGHTIIELPHRTDDGKIIPRSVDLYLLKHVGNDWVYELVELSAFKKAGKTPAAR